MVTTHTDVSSTLLQIAGVDKDTDGAIMPLGGSTIHADRHEHAAIEYWGAVSRSIFGEYQMLIILGCPRGNLRRSQ